MHVAMQHRVATFVRPRWADLSDSNLSESEEELSIIHPAWTWESPVKESGDGNCWQPAHATMDGSRVMKASRICSSKEAFAGREEHVDRRSPPLLLGTEKSLQSAEMDHVGRHMAGTCKPCAFIRTPVGCGSGSDCRFCHFVHSRHSKRPGKLKRDRYRKLVDQLLASNGYIAEQSVQAPDSELPRAY